MAARGARTMCLAGQKTGKGKRIKRRYKSAEKGVGLAGGGVESMATKGESYHSKQFCVAMWNYKIQ